MRFRTLLFWIAAFALASAVAYAKHVTSPRLLLYVFASATGLLLTLLGYAAVVGDMGNFVASEAKSKHLSTGRMFGKMVGKTLLYIFLPALIITAALIAIGLSLQS